MLTPTPTWTGPWDHDCRPPAPLGASGLAESSKTTPETSTAYCPCDLRDGSPRRLCGLERCRGPGRSRTGASVGRPLMPRFCVFKVGFAVSQPPKQPARSGFRQSKSAERALGVRDDRLALERGIIAQRTMEGHGVARFRERATALIGASYRGLRDGTSAQPAYTAFTTFTSPLARNFAPPLLPFVLAPILFGFAPHGGCIRVLHFEPIGQRPER
jgi:hypothetical protein